MASWAPGYTRRLCQDWGRNNIEHMCSSGSTGVRYVLTSAVLITAPSPAISSGRRRRGQREIAAEGRRMLFGGHLRVVSDGAAPTPVRHLRHHHATNECDRFSSDIPMEALEP